MGDSVCSNVTMSVDGLCIAYKRNTTFYIFTGQFYFPDISASFPNMNADQNKCGFESCVCVCVCACACLKGDRNELGSYVKCSKFIT